MATVLNNSTVRLALAHGTAIARERNATTFLWTSHKLIGCFNHEIFGPITVNTLLSFIKRCAWSNLPEEYQSYQLSIAPVALCPYNIDGNHSECLRCQPVLPPCSSELPGDEQVAGGDYIVFFKDSLGANIYREIENGHEQDCSDLFDLFKDLRRGPTFFMLNKGGRKMEIPDELKAEAACKLPHNGNFERCVLTGQQSASSRGPEDPGSIQAHWIYPPSVTAWHCGPKTHSKELSSWKVWTVDSTAFIDIGNIIAMRQDVYDLFQKHAFGIDIDASPRARIYIFDSSEMAHVESVLLPQHPIVEVKDPKTQAFLREHFQQCLFSGIIGGDVEDDGKYSNNCIQLMLQYRDGRIPTSEHDASEITQWWESDIGNALNEWLSYEESEIKEEVSKEDSD